MHNIIPTAEPFLLPGGRTGCLLIHGFTGTPKEMRWMGEYLNQNGLTTLGIRLAGHATLPADMIASRWTDWIASVQDGFHLLSGMTDRIYLAGLSMGGALALTLAPHLNVKGVVAMSTPFALRGDHYPVWFIKLYSRVVPYVRKVNEEPGATWYDRDAFKDHVSYPRNPVRSIAELKLLLAEMHRSLPQIRRPVLLIHSKDDPYVLPENMEQIYNRLENTPDKTKLYITESGHVITRDAKRMQVFDAALQFIQRLEQSA